VLKGKENQKWVRRSTRSLDQSLGHKEGGRENWSLSQGELIKSRGEDKERRGDGTPPRKKGNDAPAEEKTTANDV